MLLEYNTSFIIEFSFYKHFNTLVNNWCGQ